MPRPTQAVRRSVLHVVYAALLFLLFSPNASFPASLDLTWNPSAVGLGSAGPFTFDNVALNTTLAYAASPPGDGALFGFADMIRFTNDGVVTQTPAASASPYTLYWAISALGSSSFQPFPTGIAFVQYSLIGVPRVVTFQNDPTDPNNGPIVIGDQTGRVELAHGSFTGFPRGSTFVTNDPDDGLIVNTRIDVPFVPNPAFAGFFVDPRSTIPLAVSIVLIASGDQIVSTGTPDRGPAYQVNNGTGDTAFTLAIPEPQTYGLLLAGLALLGFVVRKRGN